MERWGILLHREDFKFSCAHFLIFPDGSKERLHGHNYQATVEIEGGLTDRGLVIDFNQAKPVIRALCRELNEHWLLPGEHPELAYAHGDDGHTTVTYRLCRYLAPTEEVVIMPLNNISVENLATWIAGRLRTELVKRFGPSQIRALRVTVSETAGQHGVYEFRDDDREPLL